MLATPGRPAAAGTEPAANPNRLGGRYCYAVDAGAAAAVFLCALCMALVMREHTGARLSAGYLVPTVIACAALAFCRHLPLCALAVACGASLVYLGLGFQLGPATAAMELTMFQVALRCRPRTALIAGTVTAVLTSGVALVWGTGPTLAKDNLGMVAWTALATAAGSAVRAKHQARNALLERALRAEESRDELARRRVAEERVRIARELHDVLAHHVTLVNVQAGVASHLLDSRPEDARRALAEIRTASRAVLEELKVTVGLLRQPGESTVPTEPAAGLDRLGALVDSFDAAGLTVKVGVDGPRRPLPTAVDLAAYRIVQESLTNVHRHAGPAATARVRIRYAPGVLRITVEDDGRGETAGGGAGTGHGLMGMRERTAALGGRLETGARPGGGYRVALELPTSAGCPEAEAAEPQKTMSRAERAERKGCW